MSTSALAILTAISLGFLIGTGIGLAIGFALKTQKSKWSVMTGYEKIINIKLITVCLVICIAALMGYSLQTPLV